MNHYRQKPDGFLSEVRDLFKAAQLDFDEPPPGYGCDLIVYHDYEPRTTCIELKTKKDRARMTDKEQRLMQICNRNHVPYFISTNLEEAAEAAGIRLEA